VNTFRAFILNDDDKIMSSEILDVKSDAEAIESARMFASENDLEIWQGQRRVARMKKGGEVQLVSQRTNT